MDQAMVNIHWCMSLLDGLVSSGVTQIVISPGSRSTPLVIAADRHPGLHCYVIVDERSAAFFAMGMARYRMLSVALVCTSGSAPANWYPAVVEASQSSIPLVLLTADRPWELQACGANQTIDQTKMFGDQVRAFHALPPAESSPASLRKLQSLGRQVVSESLWPDAGPVHINMPFREPLVPADDGGQRTEDRISGLWSAYSKRGRETFDPPGLVLRPPSSVLHLLSSISGKRGFILCGPGVHDEGFAAEVTQLASRLDCPILADPLADLRFGDHDKTRIISHYSLFLSGIEAIDEPEWIIRFGALPVSKALQTYLEATGSAQQFAVDQRGRWPDPLNQVTQVLHAGPAALCEQLNNMPLQAAPSNWCAAWLDQETHCEQLLKSREHAEPPEARLIHSLLSSLPEDSLLFSGNSLAIRYLDSYSGKADKKLQIVGNRGASGIDGNISTFLGLVSAYKGQGKPVAIIGDLAFFHDMNGLAAAKGLDAVLIIINNNGGGIFEQLPQKQLPGFDKYWRTPLNLDYSHAARMYGLPYHKLAGSDQVAAALEQALEEEGVSLVEVITDAGASKLRM